MSNKASSKTFFNKSSSALSPNETRVWKVLHSLNKRSVSVISIPLRKLARKARLCYESTRRSVRSLSIRGVIVYSPGKNQWITSCFIHPELTRKKSRVPISGRVIHRKVKNISRKKRYSSKSTNVNVYKYILNNVNVGKSPHRKEGDSGLNLSRESRAVEIAIAFKDEVNLGLYLSYCRKYSPEIIDKAFKVASETPLEKIKRSRGAFFTYLVKTYAQNQNYPDSGN